MANFVSTLDAVINTKTGAIVWYSGLSQQRVVHPNIHSNYIMAALKKINQTTVEDPWPLFQELRLIKSEDEIKLLQKSNDIASTAFKEVMRFSRPGVEEAHLWAKMDFECRLQGAQYLAYQPVVAGKKFSYVINLNEVDSMVSTEYY